MAIIWQQKKNSILTNNTVKQKIEEKIYKQNPYINIILLIFNR